MKRSLGNSDIPGYYCEPETKRYFKIPASDSGVMTTRIKIVNQPILPRDDCKKSILNILSSNQTGSMESLSYQYEVSALRLANLCLDRQYVYPKSNRGLKISYLRGGTKHLYGQWVSPRAGTAFYAFGYFPNLSQAPILESQQYEINCIPSQIKIADMCEGFSHPLCLLYVGNDSDTGLGMARLNWRRELNNVDVDTARHFYLSNAVYCCCSNEFTGNFALGLENGIKVHTCNSYLYALQFPGQVLGIHYNKTGSTIYAGMNDGKLLILDTRVHSPVYRSKLNEFALTEIALLDNENYMLCAGLGNFLAQVDLRMQRKVINYLGEFRNTFKNPFSFYETANVLCSTGSDNITRLWSLKGGNPLKNISPPIPGEKCLSWVMEDARSKISLHIVSKDMVTETACINQHFETVNRWEQRKMLLAR